MKPARQIEALIALILAAPAFGQPAPPNETIWYSIVTPAGDMLGHASQESAGTEAGRQLIDTSEIELQELDSPATRILDRTVTRLDRAGRPVAITEESQTGRTWSRIEARIGADAAEIVRQTAGDRRTTRVALPAGIRFDGGEGLLPGWDPATTPRFEFQNFNLDAMTVERIIIEAQPGAAPEAGVALVALRKRYEGRELRAVSRLALDAGHRILAVTQPMFGTSITTRVTDRESAMRPHRPYQ